MKQVACVIRDKGLASLHRGDVQKLLTEGQTRTETRYQLKSGFKKF